MWRVAAKRNFIIHPPVVPYLYINILSNYGSDEEANVLTYSGNNVIKMVEKSAGILGDEKRHIQLAAIM